jgi:hypothetical protein
MERQGEGEMINPERFYTSADSPTRGSKKRMWRSVEREIAPRRHAFFFVQDRRSFAYGMAAAFLLMLSSVGGITIVRQIAENAQPPVERLDRAYRSAISEFERVVPSVIAAAQQGKPTGGEFSSWQEQLRRLDGVIRELRQQMNGIDLSPLKREQLRRLYALKLQILQQMIEEGEVEL